MAETKHSQDNIAYIRTHVDNLERMVRFQISANPQSRETIRQRFSERVGMANVYLCLQEAPLTQDEIAKKLRLSQPTVSRICRELLDSGVIGRIPSASDPRATAYVWTDLEQLLAVSRIAREFLSKNSRPSSRTKKRSGA